MLDVCLHVPADATARRLEKYVERGVVTLRAWDFDWSPMFLRYQSHSLNDCLLRSLLMTAASAGTSRTLSMTASSAASLSSTLRG